MPQLTKRTANCFILEIGLGTSAGSSLNSTDIQTGRYQCFYKMLSPTSSRTGISFRFPKKLWYKIIESIVRHWQITEPYSETYSWIGDASVIADRYIISYLPGPTPIEKAKKKKSVDSEYLIFKISYSPATKTNFSTTTETELMQNIIG